MGDRAQYFLEQSLPELLDLQEKKIFTPLEIKSITKKRILFEQALTRKILRKADFLRYAEYEINLEALRVQRVKRLQIKGKKSISDWAGPRRIFFIFERATKRFHGDVDLWLQYIEYAKQQKSTKILGKVYAAVLQFHPTKPELWALAANHEMTWNGNMTAARALMQRGLRLNTGSTALWLDYFKLELDYLSKIYARRKILGIDQPEAVEDQAELSGPVEDSEDRISLPKVLQGELESDIAQAAILRDVEISTLSTATDNPALQGAIPRTILSSALKALPSHLEILLDFYDVMASYENLPFREAFLKNIIETLATDDRKSNPKACLLRVTMPMSLLKADVHDPTFPAAFRESLNLYQQLAPESSSQIELVGHWTSYLTTRLLSIPDINESLKKAIVLTVIKAYKSCEKLTSALYSAWIKFEKEHGKEGAATRVLKIAQEKTGIEHFDV